MELSIVLNVSQPEKEITYLKNFIDKQGIEGLNQSEIEKGTHQPGTQGVDILNSIRVIIEAAEKPLVELVACIQKYVDTYRSDVTLTNSKGASLKINMGRSIDKETLKVIIQMFLTETT
ncbi:MAG TPA: hypothetical protein VE978_08485 [Chitinophagales bacterium]|nr:hypothetical protein [Chitinophagales bacterium]